MMADRNSPFNPNGFNISPIVLDTLENLKTYLQNRMAREKTKAARTRSPRYRALRRQYNIVTELLRIGRQSYTAGRMRRIHEIVVNRELYPIPDD